MIHNQEATGMNDAEHIHMAVAKLAHQDRITRMQLVEIVQAILEPWIGLNEGKGVGLPHLGAVNAKVRRLMEVK